MPTRTASGRHTADRHRPRTAKSTERRRLRLLPSPAAAIGVLAVILAGGGVFAAPDGQWAVGKDVATTAISRTSSSYDRADVASTTGRERSTEPRVSRSLDRETIERQVKQQAQQREKALTAQVEQTEKHANEMQRAKKKREARQARLANQWVLPVAGYRLTARFGQTSSLWSTVHTGLDFAAPSGTQIVSVARGTVSEVASSGAYGNRTIITLEDGTDIWYCHQTSTEVSVGDQVDPGDPIGTVGSTGNVTGPHLHLEVHPDGSEDGAVDPYEVLRQHHAAP